MRIVSPLALIAALMLPSIGCGGASSSAAPTPATSAASIAPSLGVEINASFITAMGAGVPLVSQHGVRAESWLVRLFESLISQPVSAQAGFVGSCSRGGTVRVQYQGATPVGGGVTLVNTPVTFSSCAHSLNGRDITANGTLTANGAWASRAPTSPVRLSGELTVNEVGIVAVDGSTGASFSGQVGGVTVGTPAPPPSPTPAPTPTPTPPATVTGRWVGVAPDGVTFTVPALPDTFCDDADDLQLDLTQVGTALSGTATLRTRTARTPPACRAGDTTAGQGPLSNGTADGTGVSFTVGSDPKSLRFSGVVSGNRMSGVVRCGGDASQCGTFTATRQ